MQKNKSLLGLFFLGIIFILIGFYLNQKATPQILSAHATKTVVTPTVFPSATSIALKNQASSALIEQKLTIVTIAQVLDGDTVVTSGGEKIRYLGI